MHIPRAFCVADGREMKIEHTGALVEVFNNHGPYYKISADIFTCDLCGASVAMPARAEVATPREPEKYAAYSNVHLNGYVR